jgi:hypothetical protein
MAVEPGHGVLPVPQANHEAALNHQLQLRNEKRDALLHIYLLENLLSNEDFTNVILISHQDAKNLSSIPQSILAGIIDDQAQLKYMDPL